LGKSLENKGPSGFAFSLKEVSRLYLDGRYIMVRTEELVNGFIVFGRRDILDFAARSKDVSDTVTYLRLELAFEMGRVMSFVTMDSVTFERRKAVGHTLSSAETKSHQLMSLNSLVGKNHPEEG
jgi:hypothetical protein